MLFFDVTEEFKLVQKISLFWDPTSTNKGPFKTRLFDLAFDPNDDKIAYSFQGNFESEDLLPTATKGFMLKINLNFDDPNLGMVTPLGKINESDITRISGFGFDPQSNLFGFGSSYNGVNPLQNRYFGINAVQGKIVPNLTKNPAQIISDAFSCPFSLTFTNALTVEGMYCNNDSKTFVLTFINNSYLPLSDIVLKDTFPEGTIIKAISANFKGSVDPGSGIGTNLLSISGLLIPPKEKIEIKVEVLSIDALDGPACNQAFTPSASSLP